MRIRRQALPVSALLATLALFVGFVMPPAHASPIADDDTGDQPVSANAPSVDLSRSSARELDPTGYWTEEKMRSAIPADKLAPEFYQTDTNPSDERSKRLSLGEDLSDPVYPELSPGQQTRNAVVPSTAGKVFFSYKGKNYVCSGSAINGPTKNVVSTAGHCVHGGKGEGWHSNIAFAPPTTMARQDTVCGIGRRHTRLQDGLTHQIFRATKHSSRCILETEGP